jgi:RND family efflux transporter MFP subunit
MNRLLRYSSKVLLAVVLAALIGVLMLYLDGAFSRKVEPATSSASKPATATGRNVVEVKLIELPDVEQAPGTIRPLHEIALASKVLQPEKVLEVNVIAGQAVHKGDLLVKLDPSSWQNRKEMSEAKLKSAQVARDDAQSSYARLKEAFDKSAATSNELDAARYRLEAAQSEAVAAQRAVDEAVMNLGYTEIRSPVDAVVIDKRVDAGDTVAAGQLLVSLYDKMQLIANVREGLMKHLKAGQGIDVHIDEMGLQCTGTVSEIVPQADPATRTFLVKVVGPCHAGVRPGMYAKLLVPLGMRKVLVIPPVAVEQVGQLTMTTVVGESGPERRQVQLGRQIECEGGPFVQVLSGLKAGEKVAVPSQGGANAR